MVIRSRDSFPELGRARGGKRACRVAGKREVLWAPLVPMLIFLVTANMLLCTPRAILLIALTDVQRALKKEIRINLYSYRIISTVYNRFAI